VLRKREASASSSSSSADASSSASRIWQQDKRATCITSLALPLPLSHTAQPSRPSAIPSPPTTQAPIATPATRVRAPRTGVRGGQCRGASELEGTRAMRIGQSYGVALIA
jgi:hypothetical protein